MELISGECSDKLKRYWRRRRYLRLHSETNSKRKLKIIRLGGETRQQRKLRSKQKLQRKLFSPIRALVSFHEGYVDMMVKLANNLGKLNNKGIFGGKNKVAKNKQITVVSCGEEVDTKLVLQIYKRLAASRELRGF